LALADVTITCTDTDGHHYGEKDPHRIKGADLARLLAIFEAYAPGWAHTVADAEAVTDQLRGLLAVGRIAMTQEHHELDPGEIYSFLRAADLQCAQLQASRLAPEALAARYRVEVAR
jgi:hypothetical protein